MKKLLLFVMVLTMGAFLGISVLEAQDSAQEAPAKASGATTKTKTARHHMAAVPSESISGTLSMVDADKHLVVVTDSNGIPFDLKVTGRTRIMVDGKRAKLVDLSSATSKQATVKYRSEKQAGDIASSIEVGG
jgi:glucose/arabinose dehydrogenase